MWVNGQLLKLKTNRSEQKSREAKKKIPGITENETPDHVTFKV